MTTVLATVAPVKLCYFCDLEPATFQDYCEDCYEERVTAIFNKEELWVEFPCQNAHEDVLHALWTQLKSREGEFNFTMRPFTLDNLHTFRQYLLSKHANIIIPMPKQTKGHRQMTLKKEWKMILEETVAFNAVVGDAFGGAFPQSVVTFGTGRRFTPDAFTMWVPPLEFTLTATDPTGIRNSQCSLRARSVRLTEYGQSLPKRLLEKNKATALRFSAIMAFRCQQRIQQHNTTTLAAQGEGAAQEEMLPLELLRIAMPYARS